MREALCIYVLHCSDPSTLSLQMYAEFVAVHTLSGILTCWFYQENHTDHSIEVLCMMEDLFVNRRPFLDNTVYSTEQPSFFLFHPLSHPSCPPYLPPYPNAVMFFYWQEL